MNKKYQQGAEDIGKIAEEGFKRVGREIFGIAGEQEFVYKKQDAFENKVLDTIDGLKLREKGFSPIDFSIIDKMTRDDKIVFISALSLLVTVDEMRKAQEYLYIAVVRFGVHQIMGGDIETIKENLGRLDSYVAELFVRMIYEMIIICEYNEDVVSISNELFEELHISEKRKKSNEAEVKKLYEICGNNPFIFVELLAQGCENLVDDGESETCEGDDLDITDDNLFVLSDDTGEQYQELRDIIKGYIEKIHNGGQFFDNKRTEKQLEMITKYINKYEMSVDIDTVVAVIDTSITGKGKTGVLLTVHGLYYRILGDLFEEPKKIAYSDIDYKKIKLGGHNTKGLATRIDVPTLSGTTLTIEEQFSNEAFFSMLTEIGKLSEYAPYDSPRQINDMDYSVKFPFVKYMINFMAYCKQPIAELLRYACDIGFDNNQLSKLLQYINNPNESDNDLLNQINNNVPYGSRKSLRYTLVLEMLNQLQLVKDSPDLYGPEQEFINKTASLYEYSDKDIANLKTVAQIKYKIISGQISTYKDLKPMQKALEDISISCNVPLVTITASSSLKWHILIGILSKGFALFYPLNILIAVKIKKENADRIKKYTIKILKEERKSYIAAKEKVSELSQARSYDISILSSKIARLERIIPDVSTYNNDGKEDMSDFELKLEEEFQRQKQEIQKPNLMVVGGTGAGKSSLINRVFGDDVATVGAGEPVTKGIDRYESEKYPIVFWDTEGYEVAKDGTKDKTNFDNVIKPFIEKMNAGELKDRVHLVWYCIQIPRHRVLDYDLDNLKWFANHNIKTSVVITKCDTDRKLPDGRAKEATAYREVIEKEIPGLCYFDTCATKEDILLDLEDLIAWSVEVLPNDVMRQSFISAQKLSVDNKKKMAHKIVIGASASVAAAAGLNPLPIADTIIIVPQQIAMTVALGKIFLFDSIMETAGNVLKTQLTAIAGRLLAASFLKLIPIAGHAINASVAGALTYALGMALTEAYSEAYTQYLDTGKLPDWAAVFSTDIFAKNMASFYKKYKKERKGD